MGRKLCIANDGETVVRMAILSVVQYIMAAGVGGEGIESDQRIGQIYGSFAALEDFIKL